MPSPRFSENIFRPVRVPDNPEPQQVPLQEFFRQEMAPSSRQGPGKGRCAAVQVTRYRARGPRG
jgi:hypothetical protein